MKNDILLKGIRRDLIKNFTPNIYSIKLQNKNISNDESKAFYNPLKQNHGQQQLEEIELRNKFISDYKDNIILQQIMKQKWSQYNILKNIFLHALKIKIQDENFWKFCISQMYDFKEQIVQSKIQDFFQNVMLLAKLNVKCEKTTNTKRQILEFLLEQRFSQLTTKDVDSRNLCNLIFACVRVKLHNQNVINMIQQYVQNQLEQIQNIDILMITLNIVKYIQMLEQMNIMTPTIQLQIDFIIKKNISFQQRILSIFHQNIEQNNLVNMSFALSKLQIDNRELWNFIQQRFMTLVKLQIISEDNIRIVLVSVLTPHVLEQTDHKFKGFVRSLVQKLIRDQKLTCQNFASIVKSCSVAGILFIEDQSYIDLRSFIFAKKNQFNQTELSQLIHSYSYYGEENQDQEILDFLLICFQSVIVMWSAVVLNYNSQSLYSEFQKYLLQYFKSITNLNQQMQILQGLFHLIHFNDKFILDYDKTTQQFNILHENIKQNVLIQIQSKFQPHKNAGKFDIYFILKAIGFQVIPELIVEIYNIDYFIPDLTLDKLDNLNFSLIEQNYQQLIQNHTVQIDKSVIEKIQQNNNLIKMGLLIEINGKTHFGSENRKQNIIGSTKMKERTLKNLNYNLLIIDHLTCYQIASLPTMHERLHSFIQILKQQYTQ